jgi:dolichyl-phosphate beta-glucosyltransferase
LTPGAARRTFRGEHILTPALVIPMYNEAGRLDPGGFDDLRRLGFRVIAVDDGSTDGTRARLDALGVEALTLPANRGKGEAVRTGLLSAIKDGHAIVAFTDADLATPPAEMARLLEALTPERDVVLGSRVLLAGRTVERRAGRHYLGRVFATLAANILRTPFYDTQCGAKVLRVTPALEAALAEPFRSRWAFDVELLGRLLIGAGTAAPVPLERFREEPLDTWIDRGASKVTTRGKVSTLVDLAGVELDLRRMRARTGGER